MGRKNNLENKQEMVIVVDFGGQYNQLIARRVRECGVYCEVKPYTTPLADIRAMNPIGIIFTGGPNSVYLETSPHVDPALFDAGVPVLGICYGCQLIAHHLGGKVVAANDATAREYGKTETFFDTNCKLFKGLPEKSVTWMSHGDYMERVPEGFSLVAHSDACPNVAICDETRGFYGVQYHPEVNHTEFGTAMIRNFLYEVCGATGDWTMGDYKNTAIAAVREKVGSGRVLLALSGGVDSSVVAALLAEAVGPQLTCVFVDHGLMRLNEGINRATRLVQQLLTLARLDPDSTKHPASTIKLDSLAHSVCEDMTPIASQKSITVTAVTKPASTEWGTCLSSRVTPETYSPWQPIQSTDGFPEIMPLHTGSTHPLPKTRTRVSPACNMEITATTASYPPFGRAIHATYACRKSP